MESPSKSYDENMDILHDPIWTRAIFGSKRLHPDPPVEKAQRKQRLHACLRDQIRPICHLSVTRTYLLSIEAADDYSSSDDAASATGELHPCQNQFHPGARLENRASARTPGVLRQSRYQRSPSNGSETRRSITCRSSIKRSLTGHRAPL